MWSNDVYHRLSKNCFLALQSFLLALLTHVKPLPFRLLHLRRYGSINVQFHTCRLTPAPVTLYRLQNSKHFYLLYRECRRHRRRNGLTGHTSILNEPEGALWCSMFNVLNVQFHSDSFSQRCSSVTL